MNGRRAAVWSEMSSSHPLRGARRRRRDADGLRCSARLVVREEARTRAREDDGMAARGKGDRKDNAQLIPQSSGGASRVGKQVLARKRREMR